VINSIVGYVVRRFSMDCDKPRGFLSDEDIRRILDKEIVICNYSEDNLTDIGYNLTPTEFIFSVNKGLLVPIEDREYKKYCWVEPNDSVLILTREAIWVSEEISGTFHSKVKLVSQGFGHISTTLDPNWEGPLLISLNNPTKKRLKFVLGEDKGDGFEYSSFLTLIFYRMVTPTKKGHDNLPCRIDILKNITIKKPSRINLYPSKYQRLQNVVKDIQFESLGIGSKSGKEREDCIKDFKDKYTSFARKIEFWIRQAHSINTDIMHLESIWRWLVNFILIAIMVWIAYLVYTAKIVEDSNALAFYGVVVAIYVLFFDKMFRWEENK
jgi:deoxycytidine triphosphate deaminase